MPTSSTPTCGTTTSETAPGSWVPGASRTRTDPHSISRTRRPAGGWETIPPAGRRRFGTRCTPAGLQTFGPGEPSVEKLVGAEIERVPGVPPGHDHEHLV